MIIKKIFLFFVYLFALCGFFLTAGFFAIRLGWTNTPGEIDLKTKDFSLKANETEKIFELQKEENPKVLGDLNIATLDKEIERLNKIKEIRSVNYCKIKTIGEHFPINAKKILISMLNNQCDAVIAKMIYAVEVRVKEDHPLKNKLKECLNDNSGKENDLLILKEKFFSATGSDFFLWINTEEWQAIKEGVKKDKALIDQAGEISQVEPRLIVANAIVEQLRLFNSQRETFKKFFEPLKILCSANKISLGIMGIKEQTAIAIENNLKDSSSPFCLGQEYENLLNFNSENIEKERYERLTNDNNHYYSYLYGALYLKQVIKQWKTAGYNIEYRPEIVGTLFNVGFSQSKPNPEAKVGGSKIQIKDESYSFGSLAYEFYYSGELLDEFPYVIN